MGHEIEGIVKINISRKNLQIKWIQQYKWIFIIAYFQILIDEETEYYLSYK